MRRQTRTQPTVELRCQRDSILIVRHKERHKPLVCFSVVLNDRRGFRHPRMQKKRGVNFARFDPESAQLHLIIESAKELQRTVAQHANAVTCAKKPLATREWVIDESFAREFGTTDVADSHRAPADAEFSRNAERNQLLAIVEHTRHCVRDRTTDRACLGCLLTEVSIA